MTNILIISTQYPSYGGASTNAYAIIKYLRYNGYQTFGFFIEDKKNIVVDTDKIGGVYHLSYYQFANNIINLDKIRRLLPSAPDIILCKNTIAPVYARKLYPKSKIIYLVSGLPSVIEKCIEIPANQFVNNNILIEPSTDEINAIENTDIIIINSKLTMDIFKKSYTKYLDKLYPHIIDTTKYSSLLIKTCQVDITQKKYDFIIASSILTRPEKNNLFLIDILSNPRMNMYTKIIIGEDNDLFKNIPNAIVLPLQSHDSLMNLLAESKVLLFPSFYDSNPNIVREAYIHKCLLLMSNNVGYHECFPEYSVCNDYNPDIWLAKSIYLVDKYLQLIFEYNIFFDKTVSLIELIKEVY
jgi:glycosyltransferase involved in cell wall biosynthesis